MAKRTYNMADAAEAIGVSLRTLYRYVEDGRCDFVRNRLNHRMRIPWREVDRLRKIVKPYQQLQKT